MPHYDLTIVQKLARANRISHRGRRVTIDIANLEYETQNVIDCICQLNDTHFKKTNTYNDNDFPDDVYEFTYYHPIKKTSDDLYIKFRVLDEVLLIDLASFHQPRSF